MFNTLNISFRLSQTQWPCLWLCSSTYVYRIIPPQGSFVFTPSPLVLSPIPLFGQFVHNCSFPMLTPVYPELGHLLVDSFVHTLYRVLVGHLSPLWLCKYMNEGRGDKLSTRGHQDCIRYKVQYKHIPVYSTCCSSPSLLLCVVNSTLYSYVTFQLNSDGTLTFFSSWLIYVFFLLPVEIDPQSSVLKRYCGFVGQHTR